MTIREWSQRVLWFLFGAVSVGLLIFISTSHGKRTETSLPVEPMQDFQQQLNLLAGRVKKLEDRNAAEDKLKAEEAAKPERRPSEGPPDRNDRDPR
jgi:hypothetical protein